MTSTIRSLDDAAGLPRSAIGGKAFTLADLRQAGFPVPPGFCLPADLLRGPDGGAGLPLDRVADVIDAYQKLGPEAPVAVRSSAIEEDAADKSFAGIYETKLNVRGGSALIDAIAACCLSYQAARHEAYSQQVTADDSGLALLIQPMVPASSAGVLFTGNPVNERLSEFVVSATRGLGEPLVSGGVDADEYTLGRKDGRVLSRRIGRKERILESGASEVVARPDDGQPALSDTELEELAALGRRIEGHFGGHPQDIEWALTGQGFVVLQSRPITTLRATFYRQQLELWAGDPEAGEDPAIVWSRAYSDEVWTRPTSPMFYTTHNLTGVFGGYFAVVRNRRKIAGAAFRQHMLSAYANIAYLEEQAAYQPRFARGPGLLNLFPPEARARVAAAPWRWRGRLRQLWWLEVKQRASSSLANNHRVVSRQWPAWLAETASWREAGLGALSDSGLLAHLDEVHAASARVGIPCSVGVLYHAYDLSLLLQGLLRRWLGDEGQLFATLTSALDDSETVHDAHLLWQLAQSARAHPDVLDAVRRRSYAQLQADLPSLPGGSAWLAALEEFMATHYHRGANYKDVIWPRWGDDPNLLLASVRIYLDASATDPVELHARQGGVRRKAEQKVMGELKRQGPVRGTARALIFARLLRHTQVYLALRDNHRFHYDLSHWEVRRTFLAIGARLAARGCLASADDVFYLGQGEALAAFKGALAPEEAHRRADMRRAEFQAFRDAATPRFLNGLAEGESSAGQDPNQLRGLPAGRGRVTAVARVLHNVDQIHRVQPGEVLVAAQTDPGWTPLFARIGGLVLETGSVLAHGASLAREYGLPAVTAVAGATNLVRDGQTITIDGSTGIVLLHLEDEA
ncbi:MAG: PEP/pyruvate-binding domain-containing protein [Dehalococcoidia bacterium]